MVLIVLDSNVDLMNESQKNAQTQWLHNALDGAKSKPVMVAFHHPAYTSGVAHLSMPVPPEYVRQQWLPLFRQYGVKLVLNGHEHLYERLNVDGVQHLLAGPAGGKIGLVNISHSEYSQKILPGLRTISLISRWREIGFSMAPNGKRARRQEKARRRQYSQYGEPGFFEDNAAIFSFRASD